MESGIAFEGPLGTLSVFFVKSGLFEIIFTVIPTPINYFYALTQNHR